VQFAVPVAHPPEIASHQGRRSETRTCRTDFESWFAESFAFGETRIHVARRKHMLKHTSCARNKWQNIITLHFTHNERTRRATTCLTVTQRSSRTSLRAAYVVSNKNKRISSDILLSTSIYTTLMKLIHVSFTKKHRDHLRVSETSKSIVTRNCRFQTTVRSADRDRRNAINSEDSRHLMHSDDRPSL